MAIDQATLDHAVAQETVTVEERIIRQEVIWALLRDCDLVDHIVAHYGTGVNQLAAALGPHLAQE